MINIGDAPYVEYRVTSDDKEMRSMIEGAEQRHDQYRLMISSYLISRGIDMDQKDFAGETALHYSVYRQDYDQVRLLLKHHASPLIKNDDGYTALDIAKQNNDQVALGILQGNDQFPEKHNSRSADDSAETTASGTKDGMSSTVKFLGHLIPLILPLLTLAVSIVYFLTSLKTPNLKKRLLVSSHGVLLSVIYLSAFLIGYFYLVPSWFGFGPGWIRPVYLSTAVFPVAAMVYSFVRYSGNKWWHCLQLVNLTAGSLMYVVGYVAIGGPLI
jgi:hypothetical protein